MEPLLTVTLTTPDGGERALVVARDAAAAPPASEPVDAAPFSFGFTGRHDGGALPAPGRNAYSHLLDAVAEAKAATDGFLVSLLPAAAAGAAKPPQQRKKLRLSPTVEASGGGGDDGGGGDGVDADADADGPAAADAIEEDGS